MDKAQAIRDFIAKYGDLSELEGNHYRGSLDLRGTGITSLPDGLTVGGSLYLEGTGITSLPDGLTVGGYLDLRGTGITSLPDGLTVGGSLDLRGTGITNGSQVSRCVPQMLRWEYKGREFIKVDGAFSRVISHRGKVWRIVNIGSDKEYYLVTDGQGRWAHGDTISQAKADLIYKISDRNVDEYRNLTPDSRLTFAEAIECYRVITGACAAGTKMFVESLGDKVQEHYTISEMMEVTKGQYGHNTFCDFFRK